MRQKSTQVQLLITDPTVISNITDETNWDQFGVYSGPTTGIRENEYYVDDNYVYEFNGTNLKRRLHKPYTNSGLFNDPTYTDNGDGTITVDENEIALYDTDNYSGDIKKYTVSQDTITVPDDAAKYFIYVNWNSGTPIYDIISGSTIPDGSRNFIVFTVFRTGTTLHVVNRDASANGGLEKTVTRIIETERFARVSGLGLSETGTRDFIVGSGVTYNGIARLELSETQASIDSTFLYTKNGGTWSGTAITQYDNLNYNDDAGLVAVSNNDYVVNYIFRGEEDQKHLYVVLGTESYNTLADAIDSQPRTDLPELITGHTILVGRIIIEKNGTTADLIQSAFDVKFTGTPVIEGDVEFLDMQAIYVSNSGDTGNDGLNENKALDTITGGLTALGGVGQIIIPDASGFDEDITTASQQNIYAPKATISQTTGKNLELEEGRYVFDTVEGDNDNSLVLNSAGSGYCYFTANRVRLLAGGDGVAIRNATGNLLNVKVKTLTLLGDGDGVADFSGVSAHTHIDIDDIYLHGAGDGISIQNGGEVVGTVQHSKNVTGGTGNFLNVTDGKADLNCHLIESDINIGASGVANLVMQKMTGDITVASGGTLYVWCPEFTGSLTNAGTIKGRLGDINYGKTSSGDLTNITVNSGLYNADFYHTPAGTDIQTGNAWIDGTVSGSATDDQYGRKVNRSGTVEASFDKIGRNGRSLRLATTASSSFIETRNTATTTPLETRQQYLIPIKPNTKYSLSYRMKTEYVSGDSAGGARVSVVQHNSSFSVLTTGGPDFIKTTTDWTYYRFDFTSESTGYYIYISPLVYGHTGTGTLIMTAWFDDINLEEVLSIDESITNISIPLVAFSSKTDSDYIMQVSDPDGDYTNTYSLLTSIDEGATNKKTMTIDKKYFAKIGIRPVDKGTGDFSIIVHDSSNNVVASQTISNADITDGEMNYFDVPFIYESGTYHFHCVSSVADATIKTDTSGTLATATLITKFSKKTEAYKGSLNGKCIYNNAGNDGFLHNSIFNFSQNTFVYQNLFDSYNSLQDIYSCSIGGVTSGDTCNGRGYDGSSLTSSSDTTEREIVFKYNCGNNNYINCCFLDISLDNDNVELGTISVSSDGIEYVDLVDLPSISGNQTHTIDLSSYVQNKNFVFIKVAKDTTDGSIAINHIKLKGVFDNHMELPLAYPLRTNQFTNSFYSSSDISRIYFRKNKYKNNYDVLVPCLEYVDASGNVLGYNFIPIDNSQETNPSISIIIAETTNGQQAGTGNNESTTGYILNDGEYMSLSSVSSHITTTYKVGKGTTTFENITQNSFYFSGSASNVDSTQDPNFSFNASVCLQDIGLGENQGVLTSFVDKNKEKPNSNRYVMNGGVINDNDNYKNIIVAVTDTSSPVSLVLSNKLLNKGKKITIKDESGNCSSNNITISTEGSETIDGSATRVLSTDYGWVTIYENGFDYFVI